MQRTPTSAVKPIATTQSAEHDHLSALSSCHPDSVSPDLQHDPPARLPTRRRRSSQRLPRRLKLPGLPCHETEGCGVDVGEMIPEPSTVVRFARDPGSRDDGWFVALYPHLHRVACVAAPADVDPADLVQDALVKYLQLDDPDRIRSPRAFLTTTIVNLASNHRRSWTRNRAAAARLGRYDNSRPEFPSDLADLLVLPPRQRAVLYLHHIDGLSYDEVGVLVGCTAAAARKAAERGRLRLAEAIAEEENR